MLGLKLKVFFHMFRLSSSGFSSFNFRIIPWETTQDILDIFPGQMFYEEVFPLKKDKMGLSPSIKNLFSTNLHEKKILLTIVLPDVFKTKLHKKFAT